MAVLSKKIYNWTKIDAPSKILSCITDGVYIPFHQTPPPCELENHKLNNDETQFVDAKLKEYLKQSFISEVLVKPHCVSPIGCVKKKGTDKYRIINDMRQVNEYINVPKAVRI